MVTNYYKDKIQRNNKKNNILKFCTQKFNHMDSSHTHIRQLSFSGQRVQIFEYLHQIYKRLIGDQLLIKNNNLN